MTALRKYLLWLIFSALSSGLAVAQAGPPPPQPLMCSVSATATPILRPEGLAERVSDVLVECTSGAAIANLGTGAASNPLAPTVNLTLTFKAAVTSRLIGPGGVSEALLLIDEPNSGEPAPVPGFGPGEPFTPCPSPTAGCPTYVLTQTVNETPYQTGVTSASTASGPGFAAPNVYQGVAAGNQVTFFGVPVIPPATNGARVFRIVNLRTSPIGFGEAAPVEVTVSASNPSDLPLANPVAIVAFAGGTLSTGVSGPATFGRCNAQTLSQSAILTFQEPFASSFETRVDPTVPGQPGGQGDMLLQNIPGRVYSSESGFTLSGLDGTGGAGTGVAGLADFGTRLTAVFHNIPAGASVFVSQFGVTLDNSGTATGEISSGPSWAQAVTAEAEMDGAGEIPAATAYGMLAPGGTGDIHVIELTRQSDGTATATWETMASTPTAVEAYRFAVFVSYAARGADLGTARASLRYGPEGGATVPRFLEIPAAADVFSVGICRP